MKYIFRLLRSRLFLLIFITFLTAGALFLRWLVWRHPDVLGLGAGTATGRRDCLWLPDWGFHSPC